MNEEIDERFATRRLLREKRVRSSRAQMLTTKTTIVRANAFNDENNNNKRRRRAKPKPKPLRQGDVTKKRCDQCLGAGKVPCYNCTRGGVAKCDKVGFVPKNTLHVSASVRLDARRTRRRDDHQNEKERRRKERQNRGEYSRAVLRVLGEWKTRLRQM